MEFDNFANRVAYSDERRVAVLAELLRRGHEQRILLATDVCQRNRLHAYGGKGYDHVLTNILPALRREGIGEEQIQMMMVENPARVLPF